MQRPQAVVRHLQAGVLVGGHGSHVDRRIGISPGGFAGFGLRFQQMFAQGEMRVRQVTSDNAPLGREVRAGSPYRWWLGFLAWIDHGLSGRPLGLSVERAALYADPLVHGLMLVFSAALVAWRFGRFAAVLFSIGLVAVFPFAAGFLPGVPDQHGLARACGMIGVLLFLAGLRDARQTTRWFGLAGAVGALGLWLDAPTQVPILAGMALGGLFAAGVMRRRTIDLADPALTARAWRIWSLAGALAVCVGYLAEYFPAELAGWRLDFIHPLYGLAWLGLGEGLVLATRWARREPAGDKPGLPRRAEPALPRRRGGW